MIARIAVAALGLLLASASAVAAQPAAPQGQKEFQYYCTPCHGPGKGNNRPALPGTDALNVKYKGEKPGLIEARDDLTAAYVRFVVRRGIEGMPSFRKVELSDPNLDAIAAYLGRGK